MIAASLAGQIGTAVAATITVTSVADAGPGSLRDAIATAESDGLADVIAFDASIAGQTITLGTVGDTTYGATAFKITTPVTIRGSAFAGMTINGNDAIRPFFVAAGGELILEDLTVTNGRHAGGNGGEGRSDAGGGGGGPGMGGAVLVEGTLVVTRCLFRSNAARGGSGGGYAAGVTNGGGGGANMIGDGANSPSDSVGGAGAAGNASVGAGGAGGNSGQPGQPAGGFGAGGGGAGSGSHDGNAGGFGGGGGGGGISAVFATGVGGYGGGNGTGVGGTGGRGAGFGGAIMNNGGSVVASNSTFTQNTGVPGTSGGSTGAKGSGGAVFSRNGAVTLRNCTLSANTAGQGGRSIFVLGDGGTATLALYNTIAGQAAAGATEIGVETINGGTTTVAGDHNLVRQAGAVPGLTFANVDPLLFALAANGGPTSSLAPRLTSPAVNAGDDAQTGGATTDQRGFARQVGTVDIGAVEFANAAPTDIALSAASVAENAPAATAVGTLSASDADGADDTYTFTLVAGVGDTNNAAFAIAGADLVTATAFDFEAQPSASIRIRVTDQGGATYEEPFAVTVDDVNEPPVINSLAVDPPAAGVGEPVAFLVSATDPDAGDTVMLSIDYGDGASGTALSHAYAAAGAFIVTVTASDGTLSDEETVEITVVTTTTTTSTTTSSSSTTSSTTAPETTTTIASTTTSSSSTTSSTTAPPTTTTTIPPVGPCVSEPTIESVTCRLDLLVTVVKGYDHPVVRVRLGTSARRARGAVAAAGIACDRGKAQRAANRLAVANRMLVRFEGGVEGLVLKGRLPADVAAEWRAGSATLRTYIGELLVMGCASAET